MAATYLSGSLQASGAITGGGSRTYSIDAGTATDRVMYVLGFWYRNTDRMPSCSFTYNGVSLTSLGAAVEVGTSEMFIELFRLAGPASGTNNLVQSGAVTNTECGCIVAVVQDADQSNPEDDFTTNSGSATGATTASVTVPSATDDLVLAFAFNASSDNSYSAATLTNVTAIGNTQYVGAAGYGVWGGYATGASPNIAASGQWSTGMGGAATNNWQAIGVSVNPVAAAGPTIDTQPTAQTVVRTNDSRTSATFTVAATGTGMLTYAWSVDDGGGYDPISNGGIYAGATSASLVVTPTSNAQTGYSYRCTVTDDNGSTDSSGAVLTVLTGPVLSAYAGTTDGSGQVVVNLTSDDPLTANGEVLLITATVDGVAVRTTVRPATP